MVDGATEVTDLDHTEANRSLVRNFIETVLIGRDFDALAQYVDQDYLEHSPHLADGLAALHTALANRNPDTATIDYRRLHRVLAQGNFVLSVCEGVIDDRLAAYFDLFRISADRIVEHWDTTELIPPRDQWKNDNGKF